jgi:hypothetical protein
LQVALNGKRTNKLLLWQSVEGGLVVRLELPGDLERHFPTRAHQARRQFVRFVEISTGSRKISVDTNGSYVEAMIEEAVRRRSLQKLQSKLEKQLFRPLSSEASSRFLGVDRGTFRAIRIRGTLTPCGAIAANRHGRRYSYPVFSVHDLVRLKDKLEQGTEVTV